MAAGAACADELGWVVDYGGECWVVGWLAGFGGCLLWAGLGVGEGAASGRGCEWAWLAGCCVARQAEEGLAGWFLPGEACEAFHCVMREGLRVPLAQRSSCSGLAIGGGV